MRGRRAAGGAETSLRPLHSAKLTRKLGGDWPDPLRASLAALLFLEVFFPGCKCSPYPALSKRDEVTAVTASGSSFRLPRPEAAVMVRDGAATWTDHSYDRITVNQQGALRLRGLSCRVGETLARDVRTDQGYARVMLAHINLAYGAVQ